MSYFNIGYINDNDFGTALVDNMRQSMRATHDLLVNGRRSLPKALADNDPWHWHSELSWKACDWMEQSHKLHLLHGLAQRFADGVQQLWQQGPHEEDAFEQEFHNIARRVAMGSTQECLQIILRGPDGGSSNPMVALDVNARIAAAREVLEVLGMHTFQLDSWDTINDIVQGMQRRREESEKARVQLREVAPTVVRLSKARNPQGALVYVFDVFNADDRLLMRRYSRATRKTEAKQEANQLVKELYCELQATMKEKGWGDMYAVHPTVEA